MATIASLITWADFGTALKSHLGISDGEEDTQLELWIAAAAENADKYLENTDFETAAAVPALIKLGIFEYVAAIRSFQGRSAGLAAAKTGQLGETYRDMVAGEAGIRAAKPHWKPYQKKTHRN